MLHFSEMFFLVVFRDKKVSRIPDSYVGICGSRPVQASKSHATTRVFSVTEYEFKLSLEFSLLTYVEKYLSSTYFFCASQLTTGAVLAGSWWPGGLGSYRLPQRRYDPTKHTSPNYRPWVMSPTYGLVRFYRWAICDAHPHQSKNVPIRNVREYDQLEVILP
jgi:hypothetical protein